VFDERRFEHDLASHADMALAEWLVRDSESAVRAGDDQEQAGEQPVESNEFVGLVANGRRISPLERVVALARLGLTAWQ